MKVRYNPVVGIVVLVFGVVCVLLGLWLLLLGEFSPAIIVGVFPMLLGIGYLVRPYFWVSSSSIEVVAVAGPARRQYPFEKLEVDGGKMFVIHGDGTRKRVPVIRWMANSSDWQAALGSRQR